MPEPMVTPPIPAEPVITDLPIITDSQWRAAKEHFDGVVALYESLLTTPGANVQYALQIVFAPLSARYEDGERSQDLYDEMVGVE